MTDPILSRTSSRDGTPIGIWTSGNGPPLVMVHGTSADHLSWEVLRPHLEESFTVHAMDRRGRLASGDHPHYDIQREYEDVAAVVDHLAEASGFQVLVFGHSFGGACALMAAPLSDQIAGLILYEPPLTSDEAVLGPALTDRLRFLLASNGGEAVLEEFYQEVVGLSSEDVARLRALPTWNARAEAAHTVIREFAARLAIGFEELAAVDVPTGFILGSESMTIMRDDTMNAMDAIRGARLRILEGEKHLAHYTAPNRLAEAIRDLATSE